MELWVLFGTFVVLMLVGTPIAFCLGISSFATVAYLGLPPLVVFQRLASGVSVFTLMAIPFFIFAGDLMVRGGIASRIVAFAGSLIGMSVEAWAKSTSRRRRSSAASRAPRWRRRPRWAAS